MSRFVRRTLIALRDQTSNTNNLTLVLGIKKENEEVTQGKLLEILPPSEEPNIAYSLKETVQFNKKQILWSNEIECRQEKDKNKVIIRKDVLEEKLSGMESQSPQQIWHDKDYDEEKVEQNKIDQQKFLKRKGRPKGSKNRTKQTARENIYSDDEQKQEQRFLKKKSRDQTHKYKRSEQQQTFSGKQFQPYWGNGFFTYPEQQDLIKIHYDTKIEPNLEEKQNQESDQKQQRTRGAPKSYHNKQSCSSPENSQLSDEGENYVLPLHIQSDIQTIQCCFRCDNRKLKELLAFSNEIAFQKILTTVNSDPKNLWFDFSMQNRSNIVLECIKKNIDPSLFQLLLSKLKSFEPYFISGWDTDGKMQKTIYSVRTDSNYLSQTGKQGNAALFHDCVTKSRVWWKQVGIQRIIQSMNNDTNKRIVEMLKSYDEDLKKEIQLNISSFIRCGNYQIAQYLLQSIAPNQSDRYQYTKQHLECLNKKIPNAYFKKTNVAKQNIGSNYCCPIHCAAINPDNKFLQHLLKSMNDLNISDSLARKPIHYAALANTTSNMQVLIQHKFDLKQTDKFQITSLMLTAIHGKPENLEFILQNTSDSLFINFRCKQGLSALHYAVIYEQLECVKVLLSHRLVKLELQTKDKLTPLHIAAGTGNISIIRQLIKAGHSIDCHDRYKRTPLFFSIRNNNHSASYELLKQGAKYYKKDSSLNSLLHYCAAYGNTMFLQHLLPYIESEKNKRGYYPWQIAVGKGHLGCVKLFQREKKHSLASSPQHNIYFLTVKNLRYTPESMRMINYLIDQKNAHKQLDANGSRLLHYVCSIKQQDYIKNRQLQTGRQQKQDLQTFKEEYQKLEIQLITKLQNKQPCAVVQNFKGEMPLTLCIQKQNMIGLKLLLKQHLNLQFQSSKGFTLLHYFSHLASEGLQGIKFVLERLQPKQDRRTQDRNKLRDALKKIDVNGFQAILFFVKDFSYNVKDNFNRRVQLLRQNGGICATNAEGIAFEEFKEHERLFVKLLCLMVDLGCDANVVVQDKRREDQGQNFKRWGILHFLMKFPSLVLLDLFRNKIKIRDFNAVNSNGMTPLHLFCQQVKYGCLFQIDLGVAHENYRGQNCLRFLLQNGCGSNNIDTNRSSPLLYAALNKQIQFMIILRRYGSSINRCNNCNQVPFIQVVKNKDNFSLENIQSLLSIGADPNSEDLNKQTALHHLTHRSVNLDNSTELCKLFFNHGAQVNKLDKYQRTPLFYCFTKIDGDDNDEHNHDKIQILQVLLKRSDININHKDVFQRTALHYACEKNYFFSILYLLDKNIDINIKDFQGNTPLAVCFKHRTLNQAALLIKRGVSEGYVVDGDSKLSYFVYAATKLSVGICYMLLDYGYPINKALQQAPNQEFRYLLQKKYGGQM